MMKLILRPLVGCCFAAVPIICMLILFPPIDESDRRFAIGYILTAVGVIWMYGYGVREFDENIRRRAEAKKPPVLIPMSPSSAHSVEQQTDPSERDT